MGRVIVIANQKGGVGKTTTAINLAIALAEFTPPESASRAPSGAPRLDVAAPGKKGSRKDRDHGLTARTNDAQVLLIDLDPQGNATSGLSKGESGADDERKTMYDALIENTPLRDVAAAVRERVAVAPSSPDLVGAEIELARIEGRERRLLEALRPERDKYEYILIDTPPSLGLLTLNALVAADAVLVPMQCEYYALEGLSALLNTVARVRETLNPRLRIEGVALTMFDARNRLSHEIAREVAAHLPSDVFQAVIPRNVRLSESPSHGLSVLEYDGKSAGAEAYRSLAVELRGRIATATGGAEKTSAARDEESPLEKSRWSLRTLFARSEGRRRK